MRAVRFFRGGLGRAFDIAPFIRWMGMPPRLALCVNAHLPRGDKLAELRLETGILGIPGSAFFVILSWFRVFSVSALGVGR